MKRVIGYAAISGSEDVKTGLGLVIQRRKIEEYCQRNGLVLLIVHHDTPFSDERGLQRAAEQVAAGLADGVVYYCRNSNQPELIAA